MIVKGGQIEEYTIGQFSKILGLNKEIIWYYEIFGLLSLTKKWKMIWRDYCYYVLLSCLIDGLIEYTLLRNFLLLVCDHPTLLQDSQVQVRHKE